MARQLVQAAPARPTIKRPSMMTEEKKIEKKSEAKPMDKIDTQVAKCVTEMMNASTSFHKLHLKITGVGSYAAHVALKELYDSLPDHADTLAEGWQGASEKLLTYQEPSPRILDTVDDAVSYLKDMYGMINDLQSQITHSEIVNDLDNIKSQINSTKYKLLFLK
jgi:DNA-binding ferritin-like protein